ncbi:MAG: hypothetical protein PVG89_17920 [Gammaproteobacteria bacterium]|jgi:hypothetical protein
MMSFDSTTSTSTSILGGAGFAGYGVEDKEVGKKLDIAADVATMVVGGIPRTTAQVIGDAASGYSAASGFYDIYSEASKQCQ